MRLDRRLFDFLGPRSADDDVEFTAAADDDDVGFSAAADDDRWMGVIINGDGSGLGAGWKSFNAAGQTLPNA